MSHKSKTESDLATEYLKLHAQNPEYGKTSLRLLGYVLPLLEDLNAKRVLDFGCGKGALGKKLQSLGYDVSFYDPYVPEFAKDPEGQFDAVLCTDVMEHIPESELNGVLEAIASKSANVLFVISLTFADALLSDGSNAHCTIKPPAWWQQRLAPYFSNVTEVPTRQDTAVGYTSWAPKNDTVAQISQHRKLERRAAKRSELYNRPLREIGSYLLERKKLSALADLTKGKSVALVGNAKSLREKSLGGEIDAHDVVIRLNRGPIMSTEISGQKTTVLATSIPISMGLFKQRGCELALWLTPKRRKFPLWFLKKKYNCAVFPKSQHKALSRTIGSRPTSGVMALHSVLDGEPSQVTLFGFDGFASGSLSSDMTAEQAPHDFVSEQTYIDQLVERLPFLTRA